MAPATYAGEPLDEFLKPLQVDLDTIDRLCDSFTQCFKDLAANSPEQFLPTPISESILRPVGDYGHGRHLAIDIGGTNLRVGFVELSDSKESHGNFRHQPDQETTLASGRVRRRLEKSWPIAEHLKSDNADALFTWIGERIVEVVGDSLCEPTSNSSHKVDRQRVLPLGVTFSFPMVQQSLSVAHLMSMGKGFALSSNTDLGERLQQGYNRSRGSLPPINVAAIANDSVSTLVSFIFMFGETRRRHAAMGLILGTGCNATIPLKLRQLHPSKRPSSITALPGESLEDIRIAVNTEWSINGTAPPLRELGLISKWDAALDAQNETPGFQPLEYMTAGRYLGELGRLIFVDFLTTGLGMSRQSLPAKLLQRHSMTTTFLSNFEPLKPATLIAKLNAEFPVESVATSPFTWSEELAVPLHHVAKAIEVRAAGIIAAAVVALLTLAEEIPASSAQDDPRSKRELGVGYTGGCIVYFQDYLVDCQKALDQIMERRHGSGAGPQVVLSPCHDGGITGAGILVAAAISSQDTKS